jgi:tetratricopeptide (TPR) repeat protein
MELAVAIAEAKECQRAGRAAEAERRYRQILETIPSRADIWYLLGAACQAQGKLDHAITCYRGALRLRPDCAEAHYNLGIAQQQRGHLEEAVACYRRAVRFRPDYAEAYNNLGITQAAAGKMAEAIAAFQEVVRLKPDFVEAHYNLGNALHHERRLVEAIANYHRALELRPDYADAYNNLGVALRDGGHLDEAMACFDEALRIQSDHGGAHVNRAMAWLQEGKFEAGWVEYEWRWQHKQSLRPYPQPLWEGEPLAGKTILLYAEQGLGDTIQFIRYAPLVKEQGGAVMVDCPAALVPLLSTCSGIDMLVPGGASLPPFDVQLPLLSLPRVLGTTLETVPAEVPYLRADAALVEQWRRELDAAVGVPPSGGRGRPAEAGTPTSNRPAFKIGIAWQGNPTVEADRWRSIPLEHFAPLARVPRVRLINLQKGAGIEQFAGIAGQFEVLSWNQKLDQGPGAFLDTAALMTCLDLVITSDTATAHLAGALGIPVWVALAYIPEFRWMLGRTDSPWYPTMRLFRQCQPGDWSELFERITSELAQATG